MLDTWNDRYFSPRLIALTLGCLVAVLAVTPLAADTTPSLDQLEQQLLDDPTSADAAYALAGAYREGQELSRGIDFLTGFHEANEPNAMSLVWQGSLKTMLSSEAGAIEARLSLLQGGIADMDRAVRLFPDISRVRLVRGVTISRFPAFLEMSGRAISDLSKVLEAPDLSPATADAARDALARAYRQAGREEDAAQVESARRP